MRKIRIADIRDRQEIEGAAFMVKEAAVAETRAGKPYLRLTLMDASGEIEARAWDNAEELMAFCEKGRVVRVTGSAASFRDQVQLKVTGLAPVAEGEIDPGEFMPRTRGDVRAMAREFLKLAASVNDPFLSSLLDAFFKNSRTFSRFKTAPAAKSMHHACIGGLLEHTLGVARLADRVSALYPVLDRDLLMAGAMLHDIGKLAEFSFDTYPFDYSEPGRLVGHMVLGVEMVQKEAAAIKGFPERLLSHLTHLILSHHGRHEFGSPVLPMMAEAFVLNFIDDLDAKMNQMTELGRKSGNNDYSWSEYQRGLERFLLVRDPGEETRDDQPSGDAAVDPRQKFLWQP